MSKSRVSPPPVSRGGLVELITWLRAPVVPIPPGVQATLRGMDVDVTTDPTGRVRLEYTNGVVLEYRDGRGL